MGCKYLVLSEIAKRISNYLILIVKKTILKKCVMPCNSGCAGIDCDLYKNKNYTKCKKCSESFFINLN